MYFWSWGEQISWMLLHTVGVLYIRIIQFMCVYSVCLRLIPDVLRPAPTPHLHSSHPFSFSHLSLISSFSSSPPHFLFIFTSSPYNLLLISPSIPRYIIYMSSYGCFSTAVLHGEMYPFGPVQLKQLKKLFLWNVLRKLCRRCHMVSLKCYANWYYP